MILSKNFADRRKNMKNFIIASLLLIGAGSFSNTLEIRYGADINNNGNIEYFKTGKKSLEMEVP